MSEEKKMNKGQLIDFFYDLDQVAELSGVKVAYAVAKNKSIIEREIKLIEESTKPSDNQKEFQNKRIELCKEFASKNEDGSPVMTQSGYLIKDQEAFNKAYDELKDQNPKAVEELEKINSDRKELLETECGINLHKIKLCDLPEDIKVRQTEILMPIIDDSV